MAQQYDVIVAGLGAMGSATAYHLARRGKRVLGLERFTPAHDQGSSHGQSRIIRQAYFEDLSYVPLLLRAYELWEELGRESGQELMVLTGGLMLGPPGSHIVQGSRRSAEHYGLDHEMLDAAEIRRRFPALEPPPDTIALYERKAGYVLPEASVQAHLDLAARHGADLHFREPIVDWEADPSGEGVRVGAAAGTYEAASLVISPGAWAPRLLAELGLPLKVERQILFWFDPIGGLEPFRRLPVFIWERADGVEFYGLPAIPGAGGARPRGRPEYPARGVKTGLVRIDGPADPEALDRTVHPHEVERMRSALEGHMPALAGGNLLHAVTCMYTNTPDGHFVIAPHPRHPQVAIACGFSGHGYKFACLVGEILADLATMGSTQHPIGLFSPARFPAATM